jgi:hypothetical protein
MAPVNKLEKPPPAEIGVDPRFAVEAGSKARLSEIALERILYFPRLCLIFRGFVAGDAR